MSRYPWKETPDVRPWNPEAQPYRVVWTVPSSQRGCYGWASEVRTYATAEEAIAQVNAGMGIASKVYAQRINGKRWDMIAERIRKGQTKLFS